MTNQFARQMGRAAAAVRALDPHAATRLIQAALAGREATAASPAPDGDATPIEPHRQLPAPDGESTASAREADAPSEEDHGSRGGATRLWPRGRPTMEAVAAVLKAAKAGTPCLDLPMGRRRDAAALAIPDGARWTWESAETRFGSRRYRLYVPASAPERPAGLVVMLHGCKQDPDDFAAGTRMNAIAERHGLLVVWPEQTAAANPSACWNWFRPGDQGRDGGEPAILAEIVRDLATRFRVGRERTFVAGLSAGGAMAAVLGETHPDLFAAVGVHSGLATGLAGDVPSAFAAMRGDASHGIVAVAQAGRVTATGPARSLRTVIFHGTGDRTVAPSNAERLLRNGSAGARETIEREEAGRSAGGRRFTRTIVIDGQGGTRVESWSIEGAGHAWAGGDAAGSFTDPAGPDASAEMVRFFLEGA